MTTDVFITMPMGRNPVSGHKEYTDDQLTKLKPIWRDQWEENSSLSKDMIDYLVDVVHVGIFTDPGDKILEGCRRGMVSLQHDVERDWKKERREFTGPQLYKEAAGRLVKEIKKYAKSNQVADPFGAEYYLTKEGRKKYQEPERARRREARKERYKDTREYHGK